MFWRKFIEKKKKTTKRKGNFLKTGIHSTNGSTGNKVQVVRMKKLRWGWNVYKKTD